ncbi:MAG TPA: hypothetical protein PLU30_16190 [Verrucomicrobiae bacterium]|nr:hypothetical protein [Verrucomicrobiae bacterium]
MALPKKRPKKPRRGSTPSQPTTPTPAKSDHQKNLNHILPKSLKVLTDERDGLPWRLPLPIEVAQIAANFRPNEPPEQAVRDTLDLIRHAFTHHESLLSERLKTKYVPLDQAMTHLFPKIRGNRERERHLYRLIGFALIERKAPLTPMSLYTRQESDTAAPEQSNDENQKTAEQYIEQYRKKGIERFVLQYLTCCVQEAAAERLSQAQRQRAKKRVWDKEKKP